MHVDGSAARESAAGINGDAAVIEIVDLVRRRVGDNAAAQDAKAGDVLVRQLAGVGDAAIHGENSRIGQITTAIIVEEPLVDKAAAVLNCPVHVELALIEQRQACGYLPGVSLGNGQD